MTGTSGLLAASGTVQLAGETYGELLRSGPHWLFELTLEVLSAPLALLVGRLWRNGLLRHLHRDLHALQHGTHRTPCEQPAPGRDTSGTAAAAGAVRTLPAAPAGAASPLPVNWFGVPFGLAGLGATWTYAAHRALVPPIVGATLMAVSAALWLLLLSVYTLQAIRRTRSVAGDLSDASTGPFSSLVLLTPLLLVAGSLSGRSALARPLFDGLAVLVLLLAAWLLGQWIARPLELDRLHPGYLLPSVAGGYLTAGGAVTVGQPRLAALAFGLASMSYLVLGTLVLGRLLFRPALPDALLPTLAIEAAPSALASTAWLALNGGQVDAVAAALLGWGLLMLLAQLPLLPSYRRLRFSPGAWAFTFPAAAVTTAAMHWLTVTNAPGGRAWSALLLTAVTVPVALLAAHTATALAHGRLRPPPAPAVHPWAVQVVSPQSCASGA